MSSNFVLFGRTHLLILVAVVALAAVLAGLQRRFAAGSRGLRMVLAAVVVINTVIEYVYLARHGGLSFPGHLPLELCDASHFLTIFVLFTLNRTAFDMAYYWAVAGATMALLTPNLLEPFPSLGSVEFFVTHGLTVASILFLVWSKLARPRPWSVLRAMVGLNAFACVAGVFDGVYGTDYMYLRAKPLNVSLLSFLGPWPWYIVATEGVALGLFLLLYLPFRRASLQDGVAENPFGPTVVGSDGNCSVKAVAELVVDAPIGQTTPD
jgi:hypothetical integral membrane protein (TIGR02206 family)